ncbi:hypothetical protein OV208_11195 [Corallococcus sp. bb12-1]|uniref:hypothetical protein n=1 Tax=Corallococcus sp. bb12-1 TaxID=2996784 RepID=UPI0022716752|nr:hypothetical protein [Corallococcus sp. bb12-1]MCY1041879.1 hypothetical protein [Corallococcus sp. bb12-1]
MSSPWFDVPFLYCRLRLRVSHTFDKRDAADGPMANIWHHRADFAVSGMFRLQNVPGEMRPTFHNPKVSFRIAGDAVGVVVAGDGSMESGTRNSCAVRTTPGPFTLTLYPDDKNTANLATGEVDGNDGLPFKMLTQGWLKTSFGHHEETTTRGEGVLSLLLQQPFPDKPGEVRLQAEPSALVLSTPFCPGVTACEMPVILGGVRLTPGLPTFRIVDDTLEQKPIPHCRVRVLCPDGTERECVTDEEGNIFLPSSGKDVYTLLEVLDDGGPLALAQPGEWSLEPLQDFS